MEQCKTVKACIELAVTDAHDEYEQASAWLTCIDAMFGRFKQVKVMGEDVTLHGFDLTHDTTVVAICSKGKSRARVTLESIEFPDLTPIQARWLKAWRVFSRAAA